MLIPASVSLTHLLRDESASCVEPEIEVTADRLIVTMCAGLVLIVCCGGWRQTRTGFELTTLEYT